MVPLGFKVSPQPWQRVTLLSRKGSLAKTKIPASGFGHCGKGGCVLIAPAC